MQGRSFLRTGGSTRRGGLLLAGLSILISLAAVEGWLRVRAAQEKSAFEHDPTLGWNAKLHFEGRSRSPEFDISVRTNGQRMRASRDFERRSDALRIAVVGDSFAWGAGVEVEERFSARLADALDPRAEVLNFGISGFGTDQYLLKIETEVLRFHPDVLVVAFFLNDLMELDKRTGTLGIPKPRYVLRDGELELRGVPVPRAAGWDAHRGWRDLLLVERFRQAFLAERTSWVAGQFYDPNPHIRLLHKRPRKIARLEELLRLNSLLYREIRDVAHREGMRLVVVEVPFKEFFMPDDTLRGSFDLDRDQVDFGRSQRELSRLAHELGFHYVNPYRAFRAHDPLENYYRRNQHLNPRGHALLAQELLAGLRSSGSLAVP